MPSIGPAPMTVSDMLTGKRVPPKDKPHTVLAACEVPADEVQRGWPHGNAPARPPTPPATPTTPAAPIDPPAWRSRVVLVAATAVIAGLTAGVFWLTSGGPTDDPAATKAAVVAVQSQYAGGPSELIEVA